MLIRVASYLTAIEAHIARGRLEVEGVPAFVCHEHHVGQYWPTAMALSWIKVYVHRNDAERAAEIIAAHERGDFALTDDVPEVCPKCHADRVVRRRMSWKSALLVVHAISLPMYFRWATQKCLSCGHEWDLSNTRAYPLAAVLIAAAAVGAATIATMMLLFGTYCVKGTKYWLIFQIGFCRG